MIKAKTQLEVTINNRVYSMFFEPSSPIGEIHDALYEMKSFIVGKMQEACASESKVVPITSASEELPHVSE